MAKNYRDWLAERTFTKKEIDRFLDEKAPNWARFDPELGYLLQDCAVKDGMDGAYTFSHYSPTGERRTLNFAEQPCRINTYGNSFTQCHQVSDGETWQEVLAAHLGEPIRNFGVGGYGVYQAYLRLKRTEATPLAADNVMLYIWGDDHERSLMPCRWFFTYAWFRREETQHMLHGMPWAHLEVDLDTGKIREAPSQCPDAETLYKFCDLDYVSEVLGPNPFLQLQAWSEGVSDVDVELLQQVAKWAKAPFDPDTKEDRGPLGRAVFRAAAFQGTLYILDELGRWCKKNGKNLLVLLGYDAGTVETVLSGGTRSDQAVLDFLEKKKFRHIDGLSKHQEDFKQFNLTPKDYVLRYYIGHYNPIGNQFFAFAIKNDVVDWLDPKPPAYRNLGEGLIRFEGYLESG